MLGLADLQVRKAVPSCGRPGGIAQMTCYSSVCKHTSRQIILVKFETFDAAAWDYIGTCCCKGADFRCSRGNHLRMQESTQACGLCHVSASFTKAPVLQTRFSRAPARIYYNSLLRILPISFCRSGQYEGHRGSVIQLLVLGDLLLSLGKDGKLNVWRIGNYTAPIVSCSLIFMPFRHDLEEGGLMTHALT